MSERSDGDNGRNGRFEESDLSWPLTRMEMYRREERFDDWRIDDR